MKKSYARMNKSPMQRRKESIAKLAIAGVVIIYVIYVFFQLFLFVKREL